MHSTASLDEHVLVACPLAQAAHRIRDFFKDNGNADADTARLNLCVDMSIPGLPVLVELQRSVVVTVQPHRLPADTTPRYSIQWATEAPGPFPVFSGNLTVDEWTDYDSFTLRLKGDYAPPLGLAGEAFDFAIGNAIARSSAIDLLRRMKHSIERGFRTDEDAKPAVR